MRRTKRVLLYAGILAVFLASCVAMPVAAIAKDLWKPIAAVPIPSDNFLQYVPQSERFIRYYPVTYSNKIDHVSIPQNPYMAPNDKSNMHSDSYMSDTNEISGPLGLCPQVNSTWKAPLPPGAQATTVTFDRQGRVVTVLGGYGAPRLVLLDPVSLDELASFTLPPRPYNPNDPIPITEDTSGGAYFYLDNEDNVVVTTHDYRILVIDVPSTPSKGFQVVREYDLDVLLPQIPFALDKAGPALPDWEGLHYWYTTRYGLVGTVDRETHEVQTIELAGEQIQDSPAVAEDGFYVVTDFAMYLFRADELTGAPVQVWRTPYDRGLSKKPGMITQGSGTTPTIIGDLVAIADNAYIMNVRFLRRDTGAQVCSIPAFPLLGYYGCTENSLIGVQQKDGSYSVIVENNFGIPTSPPGAGIYAVTGGKSGVGGVSRIDVVPDGCGGYSCHQEWFSAEKSITVVPKMSLKNGLIYLYTKPNTVGIDYIDKWYLTAVDFRTGNTVYRVLTGTGVNYNNNWSPMTLGPDGATAYVGTLVGLVAVRDCEDCQS